ncbi:MAG: hypothetical protein WBP93_23250 [Pyrinomonadaceae bacterium]
MAFLISTMLVTLFALQQSSEPPEVKYNVAFITAIASIIVAVFSAVFSYINLRISRNNQSTLQREQAALTQRNQTELANIQSQLTLQTQNELEKAKSELAEKSQVRLESHKAELSAKNQTDIEFLRSRLGEQGKERDARRDYEYEAHKRLYAECEPLLFQLADLAEHANHRVYSLARSARLGQLPMWLASDGYYLRSTMYKLMAPLVVFRLIQQRLTFVDLTLDEHIANQYRLLKLLYLTFTDPFDFAEIDPKLKYNPDVKDWQDKRKENEQIHWPQGLYLGSLDNSIDALITTADQNGKVRLKTFGEFDSEFSDKNSDTYRMFMTFADVLDGFHPQRRPVLWRMLYTQTLIYQQMIESQATSKEASTRVDLSSILLKLPTRNLDWRKSESDASSDEALLIPKQVAREYLRIRLPEVFSELSNIRSERNALS